MKYEFKIGWCPYCSQGWVELRHDAWWKRLVVYCEECDTIWNSPLDFKKGNPDPNYETKGPLENSSIEEIKKAGWDVYLIDEY